MYQVKENFQTAGPLKAAALVASLMMATNAMATMIVYETRYTDKSVNQSDYRASWSDQTSLVSTFDLDEFSGVTAPAPYRHSRLTVEFDVDASSAGDDWGFRFGVDAGYGGAMYLNDEMVDIDSTDLWWAGRWDDDGELISATGLSVTEGPQTLEVFWAEGCCNGGQSGQFSTNGTDWLDLSVENLDRVSVPEPGILLLLGSGFLGAGLARRARAAA